MSACAVTAAKWAGAVLEWFEHSVLGHWLHQWLYAGRAGEPLLGDGDPGPAEPV